MSRCRAVLATLCAIVLGLPARVGVAEGVPEPGLVMYGTVVNTYDGANARLTSGRIIWTVQPAAGGAGITANIDNQFSYIVRLPFETRVGNVALSPGALPLNAARTAYVRLDVLEWASASNRVYAVYGAPAIPAEPNAFSLIVSNLVATPPTNSFTNAIAPFARFYRLEVIKTE